MVGTPDGRWAFASLSNRTSGAIGVMAVARGTLRLVRTVPLPHTLAAAYGMTLTHDGRLLLVAGEAATALLSVFDLAVALRRGFTAPGVAVGLVPLANGAVGVAQPPDGNLLYVTTLGAYGSYGQLWVIDAARADSGAGRRAVLAHVSAGLRTDPSRALRAVVRTGSEPVGLLLVDNGRVALVGNSNRGLVADSQGTNGPQTVSIIDTAAALAHRPATTGAVPAGLFPRDLSFDQATGQVMLANFNSGTVEEFPVPGA
jgi:DNA-binding beta-propeller fold protein YncE